MQKVDVRIPKGDPGSRVRVEEAKKRFPQCPICRCDKPRKTITDALSLKEWTISGICQECQDEIFNPYEEDL